MNSVASWLLASALPMLGISCTSTPPQLVISEMEHVLCVPAAVHIVAGDTASNLAELVLAYYGAELDVGLLDRPLPAQDVSAEQLKSLFMAHGLCAFVIQGDFGNGPTSLFANLVAGRPVLAQLENDRGLRRWHLLIGFDRRREVIIVEDPLARVQALPIETFSREWGRTGRISVLAAPG
ncbi:MAG TPA: hypothetical protein VFZ65_09220 [Planctomycetota bacterium]|nr:hypothetical protein [Planctomycetota bacterium]